MSTSPISVGGLTAGSTLTNTNGIFQFSGLSSGINSSALIQAEMAVLEQPLTNMKAEITGLQTQDSTLSSLQNSLQAVSLDAQLLAEPSTFFNVQNLTSSDSSLVSAQTSNGVGVPVGSTTVTVSQLAAAAQTSFTYTPPTSGTDTLSISDGVDPAQTISVAAGTTTAALAQQINGSNSLTVWAAVSSTGQLVLSSRNTGSQYTVSATDQTNAANLSTGTTTAGQDALYTINGTAASSSSDTVTGAIPGVTLTLSGVTGSTPVTITADAPGPNTSGIVGQVQAFINDYNTAMNALQSATNTQPASAANPGTYNPNSGSLFGDPELENLMASMRDAMITPGAGLPTGMAAMSDLGITTGASTGSATQASVNGDLTLDTTTLENAIAANPSGVQAVITAWSQNLQGMLNAEAGPGGAIAARITGNTGLASNLQTQYAQMQANFAQQELTMQAQWTATEATLSRLRAQGSYLGQLYTGTSSSGSSGSTSGSSSTGG
ncbi:flagellar filament capping protein FliD [Conexibacter sp. DBS9H8]|uniref:flagellar filament capping protein FliD n=1 Tax=Conexibacter sp. DBS9H8 TaxID=2937801 RepID=UPI0020109DF5|nr:flagellar filament capping protein FliD [Conexibacter sp. DBS9H8]